MVSGDNYYISVRATDGAGNVSNIATSNGIIIDAVDPVVTVVIEGNSNFDDRIINRTPALWSFAGQVQMM